jgi:predicted homoserine dehydrogenase-like protein
MLILDKALEARAADGQPIRVAMIGAGFMARGIALQFFTATQGMRLVAIGNRSVDKAVQAYAAAGIDDPLRAARIEEVEAAIDGGRYVVTDNPLLLAAAEGIDVIIEVTGTVEYAAHIVLKAIEHGKHVVLMNAELDGTIGPILKQYADRAGVIYTNADGDQPGVIMNLYRFVKGIGVTPVLCGNIKGLHDPYRNPTTQAAFAEKWGQNPSMVTSFADGSKISFEQAIVANATRMQVGRRGMYGPTVPGGTPIDQCIDLYPQAELLEGPGLVDYVVGAVPSPGVFVLGTHDHPLQRHYLNLYKLGPGPLYCFYTPYHLCHFEVPNTVARAVLFADAALAPVDRPYVEVVATAKIDLQAGQTLDGIGHYMTYGLCENAEVARAENLLPIGLAEGCRLTRDIAQDTVLTFADVDLPGGRLCDRLWQEQTDLFFGTTRAADGAGVSAGLASPARVNA